MSDFLPIELDAESVEITEDGNGWGVTIETEDYEELYVWLDMPDNLYDMLHEKGVLTVEDGEVRKDA